MAERLDIEDFFRETDPDLCQYGYMYYFCESGFATSRITVTTKMLVEARLAESFSIYH